MMAEPSDTFKVWITLLAACDPDGIARVSSVFISSIARLPLDSVEASIKHLSDPDPYSRSTVAQGRRIRRVDGGFEVINYHVYRSFSLHEAEAERKRLYRTRKKSPPDPLLKNKDKKKKRERRPGHVPDMSGHRTPPSYKPTQSSLIEEEIPKGLAFADKDELAHLKRKHNDLIRLAGDEKEMGRRQKNRADVLAQAAKVYERFKQVKNDAK